MKINLNKKSLYFLSGLAIGYIIGCWSSVILAVMIAAAAFISKDDLIKLYNNKQKTFHEFKKAIPFFTNESDLQILEADISDEVFEKIETYCQWNHIDINIFIEKSASFVFSKDKDWLNHQKKSQKLIK